MTRPLVRLSEAKPAEIDARLAACPALLLPLGTIEYHGHHLPLGLDGLKAQAIAEHAATRSGSVLGPTSWWAADGVPKPYTLRLPATVLEPLLDEALSQFAAMGFRVIGLVNGHFGLENSRLVRRVALTAIDRGGAIVMPVADYEVLLDLGDLGDHAGRWEASLLLGTRPELVDLDAVPAEGPVDGVLGADPRGSNVEEGRRGIAVAGERVAAGIERALGYGAADRAALRDALAAGLAALDAIAELRAALPRDQVPPVLTGAWESHLRALDAGDLRAARDFAAQKCREVTA